MPLVVNCGKRIHHLQLPVDFVWRGIDYYSLTNFKRSTLIWWRTEQSMQFYFNIKVSKLSKSVIQEKNSLWTEKFFLQF